MNLDSQTVANSMAQILAASPDCIKVLSVDGIIRYVNACGLALIEANALAEVRGRNYADFWPIALRQTVLDAIHRAALGNPTSVEGFCPTLKGTPRWWETHFQGVKTSESTDTEVIGVTRDISARRARELLLRSQKERFALILESSGDGIYEMDLDGRCTFINSSGARILGYTAEELSGKPLHDVIHHHRADGRVYAEEDCPIFEAVRTGKPKRVTDEVFWHKAGHPISVSYSVFPLIADAPQSSAVVTFTDSTERKRVENDLRRLASELSEADRRKTEFIATLAHELRNPLAPVRTGLELLRRAGDNVAAVAGVRKMMERQVGQMVHLINDLLDIARVTSGKMELKKELVQLQRVISMALEASAPLISNAHQTLSVDIPEAPLFLEADATRLAQVFTNLLNNAAKYTPAGGRIWVTVSRLGGDVQIDVADSGIGIAPQSLTSIFEMFTRVGLSAEGEQEGLGIGLNLVRRLVDLHGGRVEAHSMGIGKGSHFMVTLPLALTTQRSAEVAEKRARQQPSTDNPVRVLFVDDNVDAVATMALLIESENHITRVAHSGGEALNVVAEFQPDIVFLDIGMPGMNGYEVAHAIRNMPQANNPVLIALTGWGGEGDRLRSKQAGFDEHLTKPADISEIEQLLSKVNRQDR